jgi:tRNA U34 5-carboxymethylaminomethyl modifying GTPase MnmE/TrmE
MAMIDSPPNPIGETTWRLTTPRHPAAIAIIQLEAKDGAAMDAALDTLGCRDVKPGQLALRNLCDIDTGLIVRWTEAMTQLMPHGGAAVVIGMIDALSARGLMEATIADPRLLYPEAADEIEARMLNALAHAASPLAIDLLLDQPRRWRAVAGAGSSRDSQLASRHDPQLDRTLNHLLIPPLVVLLGPANVGKSTLTNTLAGRGVSIVADEPGTTRDHVGVLLDMAGLVVRWVDTPGLRDAADAIETQARAAALDLAGRADLLILVGDAGHLPPTMRGNSNGHEITVALRADLGQERFASKVAVSVKTGQGISDLVMAIRERLVPNSAMTDGRPWKFW